MKGYSNAVKGGSSVIINGETTNEQVGFDSIQSYLLIGNSPFESNTIYSSTYLNGVPYIMGGDGIFKFVNKTWTKISDLPYANSKNIIAYNNELHIIGAISGSQKHYVFRNNEWAIAAELANTNVADGKTIVFNNEIHLFGGGGTSSYRTKHYTYDGDSWGQIADIPYDFRNGGAVVINNELHIFGSTISGNYRKHYKYSGSSWSSLNDLPYDFKDPKVCTLNNEIHAFVDDTLHYVFNGNSWSTKSASPINIGEGITCTQGKTIHLVGQGSNTHYVYGDIYYRIK